MQPFSSKEASHHGIKHANYEWCLNMAAASSSSLHPRNDGGGVHHQAGQQEIQEGEIPRGSRPGVGSAARERGHHYHHGRRQVHRCPLRRSRFTVLPDVTDGQRGGQKSEEGTRWWLKALNKHSITHVMYIEMEMLSAIKRKLKKLTHNVDKGSSATM